MNKVRLQKYIADCGIMSRRAAEKEIEAGRVRVNGVTAKIGDSVSSLDKVTLDGKPIKLQSKKLYYILNKPQGYLTTMSDEFGRKTITELLPKTAERIYPVGRLDKDSEGLLICTNDGELANKLMHPSFHLKKTYLVYVRGNIYGEQIDKLRAIREIEGQRIAPVDITLISRSDNGSVLKFILSEGKNRQIRHMCEQAELSVMQLRRISIGPLRLDSLEIGQCKALTPEQLQELKDAIEKKARISKPASSGSARTVSKGFSAQVARKREPKADEGKEKGRKTGEYITKSAKTAQVGLKSRTKPIKEKPNEVKPPQARPKKKREG